ncbi:MAG: hydroxymethylglutaryl-CoA synthase [Candidatus Korarchaeota archaeon]|nr:hydroxymethylglutaryl-CoA synthase [Candidatus Korarchaeota archaeon]
MKPQRPVGIVGWGAYVPRYRIKEEDLAQAWGRDYKRYASGLMVTEKSVPGLDEDTLTIAYEAAQNAIARAGIDPSELGAVYVGTESKPYAVKPTSTILAEAIGASGATTGADFEFACKAGTEAIQAVTGLVGSGMIKYGLAVGADTSQGAPGDPLEYTASAGGAAFVLGPAEESVAEIVASYSYVTDTPDFWRRAHMKYPSHARAFTGEPAYFHHIMSAAKALMEEMGTTPQDYDFVVFHQPNGKFPRRVGKKLGFTKEQIEPGLITPIIGNTYSGSSLVGLSAVLDVAEPGAKILVVSFGSGAGSDAFHIEVRDSIVEARDRAPRLEVYLRRKVYVDYPYYARSMRMYVMPSDVGAY